VQLFFGLVALALPAAFGLAGARDLGLARAVVAFLALVAVFFGALAAVVVAVGAAAGAALVVALALALVLAGAAFFAGAFLVGDAELFRLLAPPVDFGLLDDRAFFVPLAFLLPPGVFDRLRGFF